MGVSDGGLASSNRPGVSLPSGRQWILLTLQMGLIPTANREATPVEPTTAAEEDERSWREKLPASRPGGGSGHQLPQRFHGRLRRILLAPQGVLGRPVDLLLHRPGTGVAPRRHDGRCGGRLPGRLQEHGRDASQHRGAHENRDQEALAAVPSWHRRLALPRAAGQPAGPGTSHRRLHRPALASASAHRPAPGGRRVVPGWGRR
jgi:hypothetical protein